MRPLCACHGEPTVIGGHGRPYCRVKSRERNRRSDAKRWAARRRNDLTKERARITNRLKELSDGLE